MGCVIYADAIISYIFNFLNFHTQIYKEKIEIYT
jgi:hypothetical protein